MANNLVIVESPAKAKTIEKFLGKKNYKVIASIGHVRDLPKSKLGVDTETFEPTYITIRGKGETVKELKKAAKKADKIFLATDPDREGEAISWHLAFLLGLDKNSKNRVTFNEITKDAVKKSILTPRKIDLDLVDAQQARRVIDRLVGYTISPILWAKVRRGLSAGRVQSVAVMITVQKEEEIKPFKSEEYWTLDAEVKGEDKRKTLFKLWGKSGKKINVKNADEIKKIIENIKDTPLKITKKDEKMRKRSAYKPFTTSTLQQEAASKISFTTKKTMSVAQQLYEGINGSAGLITYMRTDSTRVSNEALSESKAYIENIFGKKYYKKYVNTQKKSEKIQDAHECIRPTSVERTPESLINTLSTDQYKLYKLIWERFVSCSMADAVFSATTLDAKIKIYDFKATGNKLIFDGFLKVYSYTKSEENTLPKFIENNEYKVLKLFDKQHFTQPPARYSEATLVKTLEELGIGRPSTYAPTISTIQQRGYVKKEKQFLCPTELGILVNDIMKKYFSKIIDVDFTASMENELDAVENGEIKWKSVVSKLYEPLAEEVKTAENELEKITIEEKTDEKCPICGSPMIVKYGRYGKFLACEKYPECKGVKSYLIKTGIKCPECKDGDVIIRHSKKGRMFYGCSNFPKCKFVSWGKPVGRNCPKCGAHLEEKKGKNGVYITCSNKECKYNEK